MKMNDLVVISIKDEDYPKLLKEISNPPQKIFVKGDPKLLSQVGITVVGSRKMTAYGQKVTSALVKDLVANDLVIVSGLALGIDGWAQSQCLACQGKTIAVLAHGLDQVYPPQNKRLAEEIVVSGGALISEYPVNYPIKKENFRERDRIMAGMTPGTLVVEGESRSGTKITATLAADYGREVFAVPGPIDSPTAIGPGELIQQGAKLVLTVEDILEELALN